MSLYFTTFAFGGVHSPFIFFLRVLIAVGFILQIILFFFKDYWRTFPKAALLPFLLFSGFIVFSLLQYRYGLDIFETVGRPGSMSPYVTYQNIIQLLFYFLFFWLSLTALTPRKLNQSMTTALIFLLLAVSFVGIYQRLSGLSLRDLYGPWVDQFTASGFNCTFGPFINENHFGGMMGLLLPLIVARFHYHLIKAESIVKEERTASRSCAFSYLLNSGAFFFFILAAMTVAACFIASARGSAVVIVTTLVFYFFITGLIKKRLGKFFLILIVLLLLAAGALYFFGIERVLNAFNAAELIRSYQDRITVAGQSLGILSDFTNFGTGLGTYFLISSKYVGHQINLYLWNHVHNDWIELIADCGRLGASFFLGVIFSVVLISVGRFKRVVSRWSRLMIIQGWVCLLNIGVMELFDFHLKIPAIALCLVFQLALILRSSSDYVVSSPVKHKGKNFIFFFPLVLALASLLGLGFLMREANREYRVFNLSHTKTDVVDDLKQAIQLSPKDGDLWYQLGKEYWKTSDNSPNGKLLRMRSIEALRAGVELSPTYPPYWFDLGEREYLTGLVEDGIRSLRKAVYWSPQKFGYQLYLLKIYLKESEKAPTSALKTDYLARAIQLYQGLSKLETVPTEADWAQWMGPETAQLLKSYSKGWETKKSFAVQR